MRFLRLVIAAITVTIVSFSLTYAQFYYSGGLQLPLKIDSLKMCVKFDLAVGQDNQASILDSVGRFVSILDDEHTIDGFIACSLSVKENYDSFIDSVESIDGIVSAEPYYLTILDSAFLVGDRFCVAFESSLTQAKIDSINDLFGAIIQYKMQGFNNVFVLINTSSTGYGVLELANAYYELPETRYAHPLFGVKVEQHSYKVFDHFNAYQAHIKKVIGQFNIASVWDFAGLTQARTVAVLDDGINDSGIGDMAHEDLPGSRVLPGANFYNHVTSGPNPPKPNGTDFHGMACAGIIAATHTTDSLFGLDSNSGVISIAPHIQIMPIKIIERQVGASIDSIALALNFAWQNGVDVLSNSWGFGTLSCSQAAGIYQLDVVTEAVNDAFDNGRGGKGCPVIFSAGNSSLSYVRYPGCLSSALAVGAVKLNDSLWSYSHYGDSLDLVTPSGNFANQGDFFTVDQSGKNGINFPGPSFNCQPGIPEDGDYMCNFGGTSAAAPVVAGIAALILSKDSTLTAQEVYDILDSSAVTQLATGTITPPDFYYGNGRVDAFRAILSISRGDLNNDGLIATILDLTFLIDKIYRGGPSPFPSPSMGDCNCDGAANNILDLTFMIDFIFRGSGIPPKNPCFKF